MTSSTKEKMNFNFLLSFLILNQYVMSLADNEIQRLSYEEYQKKTVEFFVNLGFLDSAFLHRWQQLKQLTGSKRMTQNEMSRLLHFHDRINNAARRYQKEYDMIETGVVDGRMMDVIFGTGHGAGMFNGLF